MSSPENADSASDLSDAAAGRFVARGAFLLTPSHDLSLDRAAHICDRLRFRGSFAVTKTATGVLFKFAEPEDYQQVVRKGFHKVTGGRLYRKVVIPCRPAKTFSALVRDVPADLPEDDVRAALYGYDSVVEVTRVPSPGAPHPVRVTLASLEEYNALLQTGLDFFGATYFPAEPYDDKTSPTFDAAGFARLPPPASRLLKPRQHHVRHSLSQ